MSNLTSQERKFLHRFLTRRFNLSELKTMAFLLGYPYEDYPHDTLSNFAREILQYYEREGALGQLLKELLAERPDTQLAQIYAAHPTATPRVKVEIVIRNAVTENAQDIQARIARAMGWQTEDVGIIWAVPGSLKLLLSVPADKVPALISLAGDPQSWLPYEVVSISPYEQLPPGAQNLWRKTVMEQARPLIGSTGGGLAGLTLTKGILILVTVTVVVAIGVAVLAAPRLEIVNACRVAIRVPPDVPIAGGQELLPGNSVTAPVATGPYRYTYDGEGIEIDANGQPIDFFVGDIEVLVNGTPLRPGIPQNLSVDWGDRVFVEIVRCQ